ncbi:MAG TPA: MFS transporter [Nitrososphaerales archaeon]|nr:MFS transporter [Nitrososphaerales archaeon]
MQYKWVALSNTTIGMLMASLDGTIVLISLPAIFRGLQIDPLSSFQYLLWILFGYSVVTATLLVTFGRISDIFGRVKMYNLGFAIFTVGSLLGYLTPNTGDLGALELIVFRIVQGVGAAFLFANSAAIITDAFPERERGQALGINMVALLAGSMLGLSLGGILATINWRLIFLVNVPIGVFATAWAFLKLKEVGNIRRNQKIDLWGNLTFGGGLTLLMIAVTYGLLPYGTSYFGWGNPWVIASTVAGAGLLGAFFFVEGRVKDPMFRLDLFKIGAFRAGNIGSFLASIGRGGTQIMLIILLQGIWLPLHGYSYASTPFWSGLYITPLLLGFVVMGPISGRIADKRGARGLATGGMLISSACLLLLSFLPYNFVFWEFAVILFVMGLGGGLFASPNTVAIMNSVPPETRGAASGMRATVQNTGTTVSTAVFFSIVLVALGSSLAPALSAAVNAAGAPQLSSAFSNLPPTAALFAAFLGYNPIGSLIPPATLSALPASTQASLTGLTFFPNAIAGAFTSALHDAFYIASGLSAIAAVTSWFGMRTVPLVKPAPSAPVKRAEPEVASPVPIARTTGSPRPKDMSQS